VPPVATPRTTRINPTLLVVGGIVIVAIVAILLLVNANSGGAGSITFSPSTISCSNPVGFAETIRLPSSVHAGDAVTDMVDGRVLTSGPLVGMTQQADGSWVIFITTSQASMQSACVSGGASAVGHYMLALGTHVERVLDSSGKVLAQGSYTVTP
jgi:hypothetical protein